MVLDYTMVVDYTNCMDTKRTTWKLPATQWNGLNFYWTNWTKRSNCLNIGHTLNFIL